MHLSIFTMDGIMFIFRWFHIFFGVIWIGLLYYFNFVQGAFFAETDAATKSNAIQKLVPRALWWFRYSALFTVVMGLLLIIGRTHMGFSFQTGWGVNIVTGMALGFVMFLNVWLIIWPNQKIVIASATQAAAGKPALPEAAAAGARGGVASRTNVLMSIPMLFFMAAARNLNLNLSEAPKFGLYFAILAVIIIALEVNAVKGKTGPMTTVKGVVHCGFGLSIALYALVELCI